MGLPDRWDACSRTILLYDKSQAFAYLGDLIAVGLETDVVILDAITGTRMSVLHGHERKISFLTCSLDGTLLLSGDYSGIVKLWDVQTGGAIETFGDDKTYFTVASISPDNATIAFGGRYGKIHLLDVRAGKLHPIQTPGNDIRFIRFSPVDPQRLLWSSDDGTVHQWGTDGRQIGASYHDVDIKRVEDLAYASDGTRFVFCGKAAIVWDSESGKQVVKLRARGQLHLYRCCFSPDGQFVACSDYSTICVWNISISGAPLVKCLAGHSTTVTFLAFSSSLISGSDDKSMKFWPTDSFQADSTTTGPAAMATDSSPADSTTTGPEAMPTDLASAHLFHEDNVLITTDSSGVVKTWDLITGICKSSFSTPAKGNRDTYLAGGTLVIVWWTDERKEFHVWDVYKGQRLPTFHHPLPEVMHIKILGDGHKVFGQGDGCTEAVAMEMGGNAGFVGVGIMCTRYDFFARNLRLEPGEQWSGGLWDSQDMKVSYPAGFQSRFRLDVIQQVSEDKPCGVGDTATKRMVFYFPERYANKNTEVEWDGRYLLILFHEEEMLILDFDSVCPP